MKKIILIRHAKSSWKHDLSDINRPLKERGFNDAGLVSEAFLTQNIEVNEVFSSDAVRAMTTAEIFVDTLKMDPESIIIKHELYDFSGERLVNFIKKCSQEIEVLMLFGHNYALTNVVNTYGNKYIENVPTSGVVVIDFAITKWSDLNKGNTVLTLFPKDFKTK
jgi:phosphohistidine phosphatase